jgi:hypothetical protein
VLLHFVSRIAEPRSCTSVTQAHNGVATSIPTLGIDVCARFPSLYVAGEFSFGLHQTVVLPMKISHAAKTEFY